MKDKGVQGEVMTNEYSSNSSDNNPTITARDLGHYHSRAESRSAVTPVETALMSTTSGTTPRARRGEAPSIPAWIRAAARITARSLDARLALGVDPVASEILSARAQQLASLSMRHSLAVSYLDLVDAARAPLSPFSPVVPVVRRRVVAAESLIRDLARALLNPLPRVRGIAMAGSLLSDGAGPIFNPASDSDLSGALQEVLAQIDPLESRNL
jgi:hypothetical protein